jgi:hypothetical protein
MALKVFFQDVTPFTEIAGGQKLEISRERTTENPFRR